ncbi:MAG: thioredoxin family protein [Gracilibacteraceae bacterium]|jgi:thioredoxin 1|nr:thioredoxin family protein [Gracilibacteraceae bacterium]
MVLEKIDSNSFEQIIYDDATPSLVMFSRNNCRVCLAVRPVLEDLAPQYLGRVSFFYTDVEDDEPLFRRFSLKGVPQLLFFRDGNYVGKMAGELAEEDIEVKLKELFA